MEIVHFLSKWNVDVLVVANVFIAFGTLVLALGIPWTILYANREKRDVFYATLDRMYFDIQRTVVQHPHLCRPDREGKTRDEINQYEAFAFMVWNFLESIYDYAENDKELRETWDCILRHEAKVHGGWFGDERNHPKFKPRFVGFVVKERLILETRMMEKLQTEVPTAAIDGTEIPDKGSRQSS